MAVLREKFNRGKYRIPIDDLFPQFFFHQFSKSLHFLMKQSANSSLQICFNPKTTHTHTHIVADTEKWGDCECDVSERKTIRTFFSTSNDHYTSIPVHYYMLLLLYLKFVSIYMLLFLHLFFLCIITTHIHSSSISLKSSLLL